MEKIGELELIAGPAGHVTFKQLAAQVWLDLVGISFGLVLFVIFKVCGEPP